MDQTGATHASGGQTKEKAQEVAGQAQEKAQQATGQARTKLREQVDQRSTQTGEQVAGAAQDVRTVGEELRRQGKDKPAQLAEKAAEQAERLGGYLKESDADRILADAEDLGRKQPWAVAAGGLALGFAASRFLKASSQKRYESSNDTSQSVSESDPDPSMRGVASPGAAAPPVAEPAQAEHRLGSRGL